MAWILNKLASPSCWRSQAGAVPVEEARAGDIVAIAGLQNATVADTLYDLTAEAPLRQIRSTPTLAMTFSVNDSPLAGRGGDKGHRV